MSLLELFLTFVKIGAILLGGGYVILPILQNEFVDKKNIITQDELVNYFALSQSLPGIVAANISMFIGYKLQGKTGAIIALSGIIFVPFWSIVILATVLNNIINVPIVQNFMWGIEIAVMTLILLTTREMWQQADKNAFFYIIFILSLAALLILKLSPIQVILCISVVGILIKIISRRFNK